MEETVHRATYFVQQPQRPGLHETLTYVREIGKNLYKARSVDDMINDGGIGDGIIRTEYLLPDISTNSPLLNFNPASNLHHTGDGALSLHRCPDRPSFCCP